MNKNTLLLIASLAALTTRAGASESPTPSDLVVLPTYVVEAPRYLPVERQINASLDTLRRQAHAPLAITPEFPALKAQVDRMPGFAHTVPAAKPVRVARL